MSTDFSLNRDQIISSALRVIGVYSSESGETPSSVEFSDASNTLNLLIKSLQADGLHLWTLKRQSITLVADQQSYTLGTGGDVDISRPTRIDTLVYRDSSGSEPHDRPIELLSRERYWSLSNKETSGSPVSAYYDPQLILGVLYIWPVPSIVTSRTLEMVYQKPFDDVDNSTDDFEFPQKFLNSLKWLLAEELAYEYGIPNERLIMIRAKAREEKERVLAFDQEEASMYFVPDRQWYR